MAAGLGFKDFQTGEVLTAADVDGYLMQGIWVFANATARDAAVTSPQEGNFAYLKDTNTTTYYTGSAWTNLDTTGMVNPMTTTGDTIYSSSGSTPARLGIGSTGQVLTVAAGVPSWATPAAGGGGKVLQVVSAATSTNTNIATTTYTDTTITATITPTLSTSKILVIISAQFLTYSTSAVVFIDSKAKLMRGATDILTNNLMTQIEGASFNLSLAGSYALTYLDSPATTSATTYKVQAAKLSSGTGVNYQQGGNNTSVITLLEIGA